MSSTSIDQVRPKDLYTGSVYEIITQHGSSISEKAFISPNIPEKKLNGAIKGGTGNTCDVEDVYMIVDLTLFGSATDCLLFSNDSLYIKELLEDSRRLPYTLIKEAREKLVTKRDKDEVKVSRYLEIELNTGYVHSFDIFQLEILETAKLINSIINAVQRPQEEKAAEEKERLIKRIPLEDMPEEIRIAYVKAIISLFMDDGQISSAEFCEIYALIARLNLPTDIRQKLIFFNNTSESAVDIIRGVLPQLDEAARVEIIHSLGKDMIYVLGKTSNLTWDQSPTISRYVKEFKISQEQIEFYIDAIESDEKLFDDNVDDSGLENGMRAVISSAAGVGVPIAALYFSGSVVGLSAAGISSGLAALGLGGLFGLSGMVTGIGALLVIGYGAKKGVDILSGKSDIEKRKKKELMLYAVCNQLNKTINLIIEDIRFFTNQYTDLMARYDAQTEELETVLDKLNNLMARIKRMSDSGASMVQNSNKVNCLAIKQSIPRLLDEERLSVLTQDATKKKLYSLIIQFYEKDKDLNSSGEVITVYRLKNDLETEELEMIQKGLEALDYFSASSMAMQGISKLKSFFN
ncbi:MAG: hypothetical protein Q4A68_03360 [Anaerobiospirillum succiniciproducens]|uniref:hypothetical protein n=1 Tax=Anaerobiospirillum succiniciproducens TaxID=13335 RepID=UPI0026DB208A|nr:hypothetical protein [Anaerobiospirillum succiniciproducens]MDO4675603.1 hypothetical protein [Anaerobiospirillum succiniciproducens]